MTFPFTFSNNVLSIFVAGRPHTVDNTHPCWEEIFAIAKGQKAATPDELKALLDTRAKVKAELEAAGAALTGRVTVGHDAVLLDGKPVHTYLTTRMLEMLKDGINVDPWARFMEKLYQNPSRTAVKELYLWLEKAGMPITSNGNFLAYKKVRDDYKSYYDGKTDHPMGGVVSMPRNEVDDRRDNTCSYGLHFCSWSYLPHYNGSHGRVLVLEINPAHVVSIPSDYQNAKGRAEQYLVHSEIPEKDAQFAFDRIHVVDSRWAEENEDEDDVYDPEDDYDYADEADWNSTLGLYVYPSGVIDLDESEFDITDYDRGPVRELPGAGFEQIVTDGPVSITVRFDNCMNVIEAIVNDY
ncbi:hypothetical protein [Palleronia sp.]|uniref:hypothetical protein n=1 Tax=Palleronia sp. TaxID=1940284 RepID=UPI0035C7B151